MSESTGLIALELLAAVITDTCCVTAFAASRLNNGSIVTCVAELCCNKISGLDNLFATYARTFGVTVLGTSSLFYLCISVLKVNFMSENGNVLGGNVYERDIMKILEDYTPEK